jgi:glycosyltransferase involved in cell wall biosynthesis
VVGVPLYEGARYVEEALRSLLDQDEPRLRLAVVDDCSTDGTAELAQRVIEGDSRAVLARNESRVGLVENWRRTYDLARKTWPEARYFAWGSDHDVWHTRWLSSLVAALESRPDATVAYPLAVRISEEGELQKGKPPRLDTRGYPGWLGRYAKSFMDLAAGYMVYGLYRVDALERFGPFPATLAPDRLLLLGLSLEGPFLQVDEVLWWRRFNLRPTRARQRRAFAPDGRAPLRLYAPIWVAHTAFLARSGGTKALVAAAALPFLTVGLTGRSNYRRVRNRSRKLVRRVRHRAALALTRR